MMTPEERKIKHRDDTRKWRAKPEAKIYQYEYNKKYILTEEGKLLHKESVDKYRRSEKGKAHLKEYMREYIKRPEVIAKRKAKYQERKYGNQIQ